MPARSNVTSHPRGLSAEADIRANNTYRLDLEGDLSKCNKDGTIVTLTRGVAPRVPCHGR
jgi:hypothetical protein